MLSLTSMSFAENSVIDNEKDLRAAIDAFGKAFVAADVSTLQTYLANDYIHVNGTSGSVLNKQQWLGWVESRHPKIKDGSIIINEYEIEDLMIRFHGDSAVVVGIVKTSINDHGNTHSSEIRFTNLWIYQDEKWLRAAFHDSHMPK